MHCGAGLPDDLEQHEGKKRVDSAVGGTRLCHSNDNSLDDGISKIRNRRKNIQTLRCQDVSASFGPV